MKNVVAWYLLHCKHACTFEEFCNNVFDNDDRTRLSIEHSVRRHCQKMLADWKKPSRRAPSLPFDYHPVYTDNLVFSPFLNKRLAGLDLAHSSPSPPSAPSSVERPPLTTTTKPQPLSFTPTKIKMTDPPQATDDFSIIDPEVPTFDISNLEGVASPLDDVGDALIHCTEKTKMNAAGNRWADAKSVVVGMQAGIDYSSITAHLAGPNKNHICLMANILPETLYSGGRLVTAMNDVAGACHARTVAITGALNRHRRSPAGRKKLAYYYVGRTMTNTLYNDAAAAVSENKLTIVPVPVPFTATIAGEEHTGFDFAVYIVAPIAGTFGDDNSFNDNFGNGFNQAMNRGGA